jgi:hypothetical protein
MAPSVYLWLFAAALSVVHGQICYFSQTTGDSAVSTYSTCTLSLQAGLTYACHHVRECVPVCSHFTRLRLCLRRYTLSMCAFGVGDTFLRLFNPSLVVRSRSFAFLPTNLPRHTSILTLFGACARARVCACVCVCVCACQSLLSGSFFE